MLASEMIAMPPKYAIRRTSDGFCVAKPGRKYSYTNNVIRAQLFDTYDDADRNRCVDNERVVKTRTMHGLYVRRITMTNSTNAVPAGHRLSIARVRLSHYEWMGNPRADFDHASELEFPRDADRGAGDDDAALSWAIAPALQELEGKFSKRHAAQKAYRQAMKDHASALAELAGIAPDYLAIVIKLHVYRERLNTLRMWWNVPDHHEAPLCAVPDNVTGEELSQHIGTSDRLSAKAQVRWWVKQEYATLLPEFHRMEAMEGRYNRLVRLTMREPKKPDHDLDDAQWLEDQVGWGASEFDKFGVLAEHFPARLRKHIPVWATVQGSDGRGDVVWDEWGIPDKRDGVWWMRDALLRQEHPTLFTPTGRPKKGIFRRWKGGAKLSFEGHLKALMDSALSEYCAWADNSAVESVMEVLPADVSAHFAPLYSPGMIDGEGVADAFEGELDDLYDKQCGPWYRTNHNRCFDAVTLVDDTLPKCAFGTGKAYFPSGYAISDALVREWKLGYADDEGVWHYFAFLEPIGAGEQLELPV